MLMYCNLIKYDLLASFRSTHSFLVLKNIFCLPNGQEAEVSNAINTICLYFFCRFVTSDDNWFYNQDRIAVKTAKKQ